MRKFVTLDVDPLNNIWSKKKQLAIPTERHNHSPTRNHVNFTAQSCEFYGAFGA